MARLAHAIALVALVLSAGRSLQSPSSSCDTTGPPAPVGADDFRGQAGHAFDYWSDAGVASGSNKFEKRVKNRGGQPLTFEWTDADFFRRGVAAGEEARSQCEVDGNTPNVAYGIIKYGPNTQFPGPNAAFYKLQRPQEPAAPSAAGLIEWTAVLDSGDKYTVRVAVSWRVTTDRQIEFSAQNIAQPAEIAWPLLTGSPLAAIERAYPGRFVRGDRLVLPDNTSIQVQYSGAGEARRLTRPISVAIPAGPELYRDRLAGLTFVGG